VQFPDLRGRVVLVTGVDRPQGIGSAVCRAFADQGCTLFFTTYCSHGKEVPRGVAKVNNAEALAEELQQRGVLASCIEADLAQLESVERILDSVEERFGKPSILVNNAAHCEPDGFE
jgi:3-oxoacyl-[acyl-carrier protein] reductase